MKGEEILKKIFREAKEVRDKALELAEQKYPLDISDDKSQEYTDYVTKMEKQLLKELCSKYKITEDQLVVITKEGHLRGWKKK